MITFDLTSASKRMLGRLGSNATKKNIEDAHKKAGASGHRKMRVEVNKQIREEKPVKLATIKRMLRVSTPSAGTSVEAMSWGITVNGESLPVGEFMARQTRRGVTFSANKGKRSLYEGAFIAVMKSGHRGAFRRVKGGKQRQKYRKGGKRNNKQLPIKEIYTTGLSSVFKSKARRDAVNKAGEQEYVKTFIRVIRSKW